MWQVARMMLLLRMLTNIRLAVWANGSGMWRPDAILQLAAVQIEYVRYVKAGGALRRRHLRIEETVGERASVGKVSM